MSFLENTIFIIFYQRNPVALLVGVEEAIHNTGYPPFNPISCIVMHIMDVLDRNLDRLVPPPPQLAYPQHICRGSCIPATVTSDWPYIPAGSSDVKKKE